MGNSLGGGGGGYGHVGYGPELQCCKGVVDPITLLSVLAGIGVVTYLLYQAAINNIAKGGRKRRGLVQDQEDFLNSLIESNPFISNPTLFDDAQANKSNTKGETSDMNGQNKIQCSAKYKNCLTNVVHDISKTLTKDGWMSPEVTSAFQVFLNQNMEAFHDHMLQSPQGLMVRKCLAQKEACNAV